MLFGYGSGDANSNRLDLEEGWRMAEEEWLFERGETVLQK